MKTTKLLLPCLLFFTLLTSLSSCKDDDNNNSLYPPEYYEAVIPKTDAAKNPVLKYEDYFNTEWGSAQIWFDHKEWRPIEGSLIFTEWDDKSPEYLRIITDISSAGNTTRPCWWDEKGEYLYYLTHRVYPINMHEILLVHDFSIIKLTRK